MASIMESRRNWWLMQWIDFNKGRWSGNMKSGINSKHRFYDLEILEGQILLKHVY